MGNYDQITVNGQAHLGDQYFLGQTRREFLEWLSPLDYEAKHEAITEQRLVKTGEWVIKSEIFKWWQSRDSNLAKTFLCHGTRGVGKTFFVSTVIDYLKEARKTDSSIGVAWVYCDDYGEKKTLTDLIRSLLRQLIQLRDDMSEPSKCLYKKYSDGHGFLGFPEAMKLFKSEVERFSRVFVVIDALDEYDNDRNNVEDKLLDFSPAETKELEMKRNDEDVQAYIDARFKRGISKWPEMNDNISQNPELSNRLSKSLVDAAQGLLLFAKLDADKVSKLTSINDIESAINRPLQSGDTKFMEAIERIKEKEEGHRELAEQVLSWLSSTFRHLTIRELTDAVAMNGGKTYLGKSMRPLQESLVDVCDGLVVTDPKTDKIRLFHDTAYDYFRRNPIIQISQMHESIAVTCLNYILLNPFAGDVYLSDKDLHKRLNDYPLLRYATRHWGDHLRELPSLTPTVRTLALKLLNNKELLASIQASAIAGQQYPGDARHFDRNMTRMQVAALFGLTSIVECLKGLGIDVNEVDNRGRAAVHTAAERGHLAMIIWLVKNGSNPDTSDTRGHTALHLAAFNGHLEIVRWLVENGANANASDAHGQTALHLAASSGFQEIAKTLMCNCNVTAKDKNGLTALKCAVNQGHQEVVEILGKGEAFMCACVSGRLRVVRSVPPKRHHARSSHISPEMVEGIRIERGFITLNLAALLDSDDLVRLRLKKRADLDHDIAQQKPSRRDEDAGQGHQQDGSRCQWDEPKDNSIPKNRGRRITRRPEDQYAEASGSTSRREGNYRAYSPVCHQQSPRIYGRSKSRIRDGIQEDSWQRRRSTSQFSGRGRVAIIEVLQSRSSKSFRQDEYSNRRSDYDSYRRRPCNIYLRKSNALTIIHDVAVTAIAIATVIMTDIATVIATVIMNGVMIFGTTQQM
ncbi:hypothetical protein F5Y10DRAFT_287848 [Nemania abortiva]|nr:hypothetical protein F5Y10DRAFT_287848 [Nemania abortiva]